MVTLLQYFISIHHDSCSVGQQRNAGGGTENGTGKPQQQEMEEVRDGMGLRIRNGIYPYFLAISRGGI